MEKKKSHNKTLLIVIIILLVFFMLLGIFIGTKITSKEDAKRPSLQEEKDSPKEEEIIEEVSIGYISSFDSIRDNMTYLPTYNKKIKSSEIPKLDILSTTINNIFNLDSSEDNALLFEDIKSVDYGKRSVKLVGTGIKFKISNLTNAESIKSVIIEKKK